METAIETKPPKIPRLSWQSITAVCVLAILALFVFRADLVRVLPILNSTKNALEEIAKDISNPGALRSKIESRNAFLTEAGVLEFTNSERINAQLKTFTSNQKLSDIAERRLQDMFAKQYFEHVSPEGTSASTEADVVGYEYVSIGENIALGNFDNDQVIVQAWMDSPGHRANILSPKFTEIGIAVGRGEFEGKATWIGVQIFGKPLTACPAVSATLRKSIEADENKIESLDIQIKTVEREIKSIESSKEKRPERYNSLIDEYNSLANQINILLTSLKLKVTDYNNQVRIFNKCVEG